jgi:prolyl-tRNA synthetase
VLVKRVNGEKTIAPIETIEKEIPDVLTQIHKAMYEKALAFLKSHIVSVTNLEELKAALNKGGYAKMPFCGKAECELKIKELTEGGTARCIAEEAVPAGAKCPICGEPATIVAYFAKAY